MMGRRGFLEFTGAGGLAMLGGRMQLSDDEVDLDDVDSYGLLVGPQSNRPPNGGAYLSQWDTYQFIYLASDTGRRFQKTHLDESWHELLTTLKQLSESQLPVGEQGTIVWNTDRDVIAFFDGNDYEYPIVGDDILLTPVTVQNTTTETDIWDAGLSVGSIKVGRVYKVKLYGQFSNASTSDNVTVRFYIGGAEVGAVTSTGQNASDAPWSVKLTMTVLESGPSGTVEPHAEGTFNNDNADDTEEEVTIDTTIPEEIEATAQWNNAKAGNVFEITQGYMKEIS